MTHLLAGVDTGGTFTDIVLLQEGKLRVFKVLSTPDDPSRAILSGLGQLDAEETKQAGLTAATTFHACKHIAGLGRLFDARLQSASMKSADRDQAIARVVVSFAAKDPSTTPELRTQPMASRGADSFAGDTAINTPAPSVGGHPRWDVYRSGLGTSAFVYDR